MNKFRNFMYGRYGSDQLNLFLLVVAFVISIINFPFAFIISIILIIIAFARMFSRNIYKRQIENAKFLGFFYRLKSSFSNIKRRFDDRKIYKYFKCTKCNTNLRVPKGKGRIKITCPKCGNKFERNT